MTSSTRRDPATAAPPTGLAAAVLTASPAGTVGPLGPGAASAGVDAVRALLHDLRQPLAAIRMLSDGAAEDPRLAAIHHEAQWLSDLVEEVLGTARQHEPLLCDLRGIAADCVRRAGLTSSCSVTLEQGGPGAVVADPRALARAIGCVVDNAVRAAGPAGRVRVFVRSAADQVTVVVEDDGPGLGQVRAQHSMGLTITRALLASYGGSVALLPGTQRGAVAVLSLPSAATDRAVAS